MSTDNEATGIIQPSPLLKSDEHLLICPALLSTQNNKCRGANQQLTRPSVYTEKRSAIVQPPNGGNRHHFFFFHGIANTLRLLSSRV